MHKLKILEVIVIALISCSAIRHNSHHWKPGPNTPHGTPTFSGRAKIFVNGYEYPGIWKERSELNMQRLRFLCNLYKTPQRNTPERTCSTIPGNHKDNILLNKVKVNEKKPPAFNNQNKPQNVFGNVKIKLPKMVEAVLIDIPKFGNTNINVKKPKLPKKILITPHKVTDIKDILKKTKKKGQKLKRPDKIVVKVPLVTKDVSTPSPDTDTLDNFTASAAGQQTTLIETTSKVPETVTSAISDESFQKHVKALEEFEKSFYQSTFTKLRANSPAHRRENGISFVQSSLFLYMALTVLSTDKQDVDELKRKEISQYVADTSDEDKISTLSRLTSLLPASDSDMRLRWSSRLVLPPTHNMSNYIRDGIAKSMQLHVMHLNHTDEPANVSDILNTIVWTDSGGAMRDTFDQSEVSEGIRGVLLHTLYFRARWRTDPTLLNGTTPFRELGSESRNSYMFRVNDVMGYADITEWDAEAIEIPYSTSGLSLLVVVPRGLSLEGLAGHVARRGVGWLQAEMRRTRIALAMPLYTLRMTLLLPNKLREMGISRLVPEELQEADDGDGLVLSHAVQRLMFWAEAGKNAFKDDGLEWDEKPDMSLVVDRPYVFFVRFQNITLLSGNFVL